MSVAAVATRIHVIYGADCGDVEFRVIPSCRERPYIAAPEWILVEALAADGLVKRPGRLGLLLRSVKGPFSVLKAAALEPEDWEPLLWLSAYTSDKPTGGCAALLPFAPSTSSLSALTHREACIDAYMIPRGFLEQLIYAAGGSGVEDLYLLNPEPTWLFSDAKLRGPLARHRARAMSLPRFVLSRVGETVVFDEVEDILEGSLLEVSLPKPGPVGDLLAAAFPGADEVAYTLLDGVEESGYVLSYRAFLEMAGQIGGKDGYSIGQRLVLYGYLSVRQAQVVPTSKGLYVLTEQRR